MLRSARSRWWQSLYSDHSHLPTQCRSVGGWVVGEWRRRRRRPGSLATPHLLHRTGIAVNGRVSWFQMSLFASKRARRGASSRMRDKLKKLGLRNFAEFALSITATAMKSLDWHSNYCNLPCAKIMLNIPEKRIRNHLRHSCCLPTYGKVE